ncbi:MAG: hypothetical protein DRJ03_23935 [Chloroflexi bacterium]|nr:MAG: hypothetical protein DRJ03_23935 [Chloroflexota bacterium]
MNYDSDPMDDHGHGTHCAGIIAAVIDNNEGIAGLAQVKIMAEKALNEYGWGWDTDLANAIIHAVDQGADILSNSWGGLSPSEVIHDAIEYAYENNVLVVAAAGNEGIKQKVYPAAYDEVIAVTATDSNDDPAWFTSFGDWVEVAAPGVDIYSTVWDDSYTYMSGTSMACPHVSGVAALILSQFPNMTKDWVRAQLRCTADDLGDPGFDEYYGYGRVNAREAVEQAPPNHDLMIFKLSKPRFIQPGTSVTFNVSVLNFGLNDESNITVELLVDGSTVNSSSIDFLASGTLTTVNLTWATPSLEKTYNVTVWVIPVPGENNVDNNVLWEYITVQYTAVALFKNLDPWGYPSNEEVFSLYGIPYTVFSSTDMGKVDLSPFSKVVIASDQDQSFYDTVSIYRWWFEDYVSSGGVLEIHAADWGWNGGGWTGLLPGGVSWYHSYEEYVTIVDPLHPVITTPNPITDAELDEWHYSIHGYFISYPADSHIVITDDYSRCPVYLEFKYGAGTIIASGQTLEWAYLNGYSLILENSLLYMPIKYPHELTVCLEVPSFLEPGNSSLLNATVYNNGLNNETNVQIQLYINGKIVENQTIPLLVNGTSYTIQHLWAPTVKGTYNITAYVPPVPNENITINNIATKFVQVTYPLIKPVEGQYASYIYYYTDPYGDVSTCTMNFTYNHYVSPYEIYIDYVFEDPYGEIYYEWMIVNIMNRYVEEGVWAGMWYPGWIETNITVGSVINLLYSTGIVNGSAVINIGIYPIDCWEVVTFEGECTYRMFYDKATGLWVKMIAVLPWGETGELLLIDTNVPIGTEYDHELAVELEAPNVLEPSNPTLLNITVYNIGLNAENDINVQLFVNGTIEQSWNIPTLENGSSCILSYSWTPVEEAIYNVTAYVIPVENESFVENNVATRFVQVRKIKGYILFDQTHGTVSIDSYTIWLDRLEYLGFIVETHDYGPITEDLLEEYDVFVTIQAYTPYSSSELEAIQNFVLNGGGLLVIGDDNPYIYTELTSFADITWGGGGCWGITYDITPHEVTEGVDSVYLESPMSVLYVSGDALSLVRDPCGNTMLAVAEVGGKVAGFADENSFVDYSIMSEDNLILAGNLIVWLALASPVPVVTYEPLDPYVGEVITFDASKSYDPDGTIVSYEWDFGDGSTANGSVVTHAYKKSGTFTVTLTLTDDDGQVSTVTLDVKVSRTTLNVEVEVGSIHFRNELTQFYILVTQFGQPIDANITACLYYNGSVLADLSSAVSHVETGVYLINYKIPSDAPAGTYMLLVKADRYGVKGSSIATFLISSTLTGWNAKIIEISDNIATVVIPDLGTIKLQLDDINATIAEIHGKTVTIETILGTIKGNITSISGDIFEIKTDVGFVRTTLEGWTGQIALAPTDKGTFKILLLTTSTIEGEAEFSDDVIQIVVSGTPGTSGTLVAVIPEQLLADLNSDPSKIKVLIDDSPVSFTTQKHGDSYTIRVNYTHSTHVIKIFLAEKPLPAPTQLQIVILMVALLAILLTTYLYIRRKKKAKENQ